MGTAGRWLARVAAMAGTLALAACGGGGGGASGGDGMVRVSLTDAPACYEQVNITVEAIRFHTSGTAGENAAGWHELRLTNPQKIDLLGLTNGVLEELGTLPLPAGKYSQVRLVLAENTPSRPPANSVVPLGEEAEVALKTPSGQQSGTKLQVHFEVEADKEIDLVLDFDACKSVVKRGNRDEYLLKPVINVTPEYVASIQGTLTTTMALSATTVSAQQNGTVVRATVPRADGTFKLAFLPAGTYTVVITSEGRATSIVTSVPVGTATITRLNGTSTRIVSPTSAMGTVTGTVTQSTGSGTATEAVTGGLVRAMQDVLGTTVEVNARQTDDLGGYTLRLPLASPRRAVFASGRIGAFSADSGEAGRYQLRVTADGQGQITRNINLGADSTITSNFNYD